MTTAADAFFEEASPPKDMEWTPPRTQPEVSPQSSRPWFILQAAVAVGVAMRVLAARDLVSGPSIVYGIGWAAALAGCAFGALILARSRDAVTSRHVADAGLLAIATGGFTWLFPHYNTIIVTELMDRIGLVLINAGAGLLVGALIVLALARARTSVATVSFLVSCLLVLVGALFFRTEADHTVGLLILIAAWAFAIAGWNDRARGPRRRPPDSATLRSPRSMVSFATAACSAFALREAFSSGIWADELPAILLIGLMFIAALVSVFDARRQIAESPSTISNWSEWRASVETGVYDGPEGDAADDADGSGRTKQQETPDKWAPSPTTGELELITTSEEPGAIPGAWDPSEVPAAEDQPAWRTSGAATTHQPTLATIGPRLTDDNSPAKTGATSTAGFSGTAGFTGTAGTTGTPGSDNPAFIPVPSASAPSTSSPTVPRSTSDRTASELQVFPAASAWTIEGELLGANATFWELSQSEPSDGFGLLRIVHPDDRPELALQVTRGTRANLAFSSVVRLIDPATLERLRIDVVGGPFDESTSPLGAVPNATYQVSFNMPRPDTAGEVVATSSMYDPLTGLGSSAYLDRWLSERSSKTKRRNDRPLLIVVELADLGQYEQSEPRLRDVIMTEAAHAMHKVCRSGDFVVRLDGPYFAVVIEEVVEGEEWYLLQRFEQIVKGVFTIAGRPFKIDGRLLPLRPNPGAALDDILDQVASLLVADSGPPVQAVVAQVPGNAASTPDSDTATTPTEPTTEPATVSPAVAATEPDADSTVETDVAQTRPVTDAVVTQLFREAPETPRTVTAPQRKSPTPDPRALGGFALPPSAGASDDETDEDDEGELDPATGDASPSTGTS